MESDETLKYTDFKLMSNDKKIHPCRKHMLDSNFPVFKAMLEMDCAETNQGLMEISSHGAQTVKTSSSIHMPQSQAETSLKC